MPARGPAGLTVRRSSAGWVMPRGLLAGGASQQQTVIRRITGSTGLTGAALERLRRLIAATLSDRARN